MHSVKVTTSFQLAQNKGQDQRKFIVYCKYFNVKVTLNQCLFFRQPFNSQNKLFVTVLFLNMIQTENQLFNVSFESQVQVVVFTLKLLPFDNLKQRLELLFFQQALVLERIVQLVD